MVNFFLVFGIGYNDNAQQKVGNWLESKPVRNKTKPILFGLDIFLCMYIVRVIEKLFLTY